MRTLIKNAKCVLPRETGIFNIIIENKKIALIDPPPNISVNDTIDANGLVLIPGVIDCHVHLREPGLTHKEDLITGSCACAKGGVTSFLEMPNTNPPTISIENLRQKLNLASHKSIVNYGFFIGATPDNIDQLSSVKRTPGIKIYIGSSTGDLLVDEQDPLERIFAETSLKISAHCEDETSIRNNSRMLNGGKSYSDHSRIRDENAALIATQRAVELAVNYNHRLHIAHVSTAKEIEIIRRNKNLVTTEVCPHHLYFNINDYDRLGSKIQMNPAVKSEGDNDALWKALIEDDIQIVASDHAPHTIAEKSKPYPKSPSGIPSVENILPLILDAVNNGKISLERVVKSMCENPAKIWNIANKGIIAEGYDADLVLIDMNKKIIIKDEEQVTKCKWSPWNGEQLTGVPTYTWVMGNLVYHNDKFDSSKAGSEIVFNQ